MPKEEISEVKVMYSFAGYYIGHEYFDEELGDWLPYDRISSYFKSEAEAKRELAFWKSLEGEVE